jgi:hypothetical protein
MCLALFASQVSGTVIFHNASSGPPRQKSSRAVLMLRLWRLKSPSLFHDGMQKDAFLHVDGKSGDPWGIGSVKLWEATVTLAI